MIGRELNDEAGEQRPGRHSADERDEPSREQLVEPAGTRHQRGDEVVDRGVVEHDGGKAVDRPIALSGNDQAHLLPDDPFAVIQAVGIAQLTPGDGERGHGAAGQQRGGEQGDENKGAAPAAAWNNPVARSL